MTQPLSNEEKLDEIYRMLKKEESRRARWAFYKLLKYGIIFGFLILILTNPVFIVTQISNLLTPIVLDTVKTTLETEQSSIIESLKNLIPTTQQ